MQNCADKFLKHSERVGARFAEHNAGSALSPRHFHSLFPDAAGRNHGTTTSAEAIACSSLCAEKSPRLGKSHAAVGMSIFQFGDTRLSLARHW